MEIGTFQPEDVHAYIESSYIPEIIIVALTIFVTYWIYAGIFSWPFKERALTSPIRGLPCSSCGKAGQCRKYRKIMDSSTKHNQSRQYIMGRPLKQRQSRQNLSLDITDMDYLETRSGAKYPRQ